MLLPKKLKQQDLRKISLTEETLIKQFIAFQSKFFDCYIFSETYSYSYVAINQSDSPLEITVDASTNSKDMVYLPKSGIVTKVIQPGEMEFMIHVVADPSKETFSQKVTVDHRVI